VNKKLPKNEFPIVNPIFCSKAALSPYCLQRSVAKPSMATSYIPRNKHMINPHNQSVLKLFKISACERYNNMVDKIILMGNM
jgi:hypothetical protein